MLRKSKPVDMIHRYLETRSRSRQLVAGLSPEDMQVQSMEDASPAKWHLAHTTWFFETFILIEFASQYSAFDSEYRYLFNSYYNGVGPQFQRNKRGLLTRPSFEQVLAYRKHVDDGIQELLRECDRATLAAIEPLIELGIQHEQQHQELLLTDIKHAFFQNPQFPALRRESEIDSFSIASELDWLYVPEGIYQIGRSPEGFCFDNETPGHRAFIEPCWIATRLSTNAEYLAFIEDGGYRRPEYWLSEAWQFLQSNRLDKPLYWLLRNDAWFQFTFKGLERLDPNAPIMHVNYYEADAFARWCGKRLPTEQEWEAACRIEMFRLDLRTSDDLLSAAQRDSKLKQLFYCLWQWTSSSYSPYPGYRPLPGTVGEYNGKFMVNQYVLRGGSVATPNAHMRLTYRNFFPASASWQFSGIRLVDSAT